MSFFLYLVYVSVTFLRIDVLFPDLVPLRPMLSLMLLCLMAAIYDTAIHQRISARPRHFALLGLLVVVVAASQIVNGWMGGALQSLGYFMPSAVIAVLTWLNVTTLRRLKITCGVIVCSLLALVVTGAISFETGFMQDKFVLRQSGADDGQSMPNDADSDEDDEAVTGNFLRLKGIGFLADPNDFAQAIVMVLPLLWGFHKRRAPFRNLLYTTLPGCIFLYAIYLTHSRGALIGLLALLAFGVRKRLGTVRTVLLVAALIGAVQFSDFNGGREISTQETSAGDRIESWNVGIHLLAQHPLLGVGFGNYENYNVLTAHNSFVLCFTELGLVGFFLWMGLLVQAYKSTDTLAKTAAEDSPEKLWGSMLRAALIGFMGCAWFLSRTYEPLLYLLISLCIAIRFCGESAPRLAMPTLAPALPPIPWAKSTAVSCLVAISAAYATIVMQRVLGH